MGRLFEISKGLTIPLAGEPSQQISEKSVRRVALVGSDYHGLRPTMLVAEGDEVKLGQPIMVDKQTEGVVFVAPAGGRVSAINRGEKRKFLSLVIDISDSEQMERHDAFSDQQISNLSRDDVVARMVATGLWTSLRTRPFGKIPALDSIPTAIFVNAMDTNPLAVDPALVIRSSEANFLAGLKAIRKLTTGDVFLCRGKGVATPGDGLEGIKIAEFGGPHPAGLVGTHMHFLKPASASRVNWHLNYQDVIAIGLAFLEGRLDPVRVISLGGPAVSNPRLILTRLGASIHDLVDGELAKPEGTRETSSTRVVSGSLLHGRKLEELTGFLGRYHLQVSCLYEGNRRELLGWQRPGLNKFSITRAFAGAWSSTKLYPLTTSSEGSVRAMVPIGTYEKVMPMDLLPTLLLRALIVKDTVQAQELGCLELDEEDLGLCTFVCPGKYDYPSILRDNLSIIEQEG